MIPLQIRAPVSHLIALADLRPTQMCVGMIEVEEKAARLKAVPKGERLKHIVPCVHGPKGRFYIVDHHHLCRALLLSGVKQVAVTSVLDLRGLKKEEFWPFMDCAGLVHPFDEHGKRRPYADIPKTLAAMPDDLFRSLAGQLRRQGVYAKDAAPFSEFLWADFLRHRVTKTDFKLMLKHAAELAQTPAAAHLPGWCGPTE